MFNINVKGLSGARRRIVRPTATRDWRCPSCRARNRYYWSRCPVCRHPRPEES